jgi:O-antigen/teichoic acid export membrane protein
MMDAVRIADTPLAGNDVSMGSRSMGSRVRSAVLWRSGSQIFAQLVQWAATFMVIRILSPSDYGLFAMTQVVLVFLNMLNGYGLASGLVQQTHVTQRQIRQMFGMLIVMNTALAAIQFALAPVVATYYGHPTVAVMLRVQAVMYITTPFAAVAYAMLSRAMDFKHLAAANVAASVASASAALIGALAGLGLWTLVFAPIVFFSMRAAVMTWAARTLMWPMFDFRGAGALARYGAVMALGQAFWFVQSQADVFIAGRSFSPHVLGLYTTSLFLAQIFVAKVVPPLNEIAFSAYSRLQHDPAALADAFVRGMRIVMAGAMPFYVGLAITAEPLVLTVLGEKWVEVVPIVRLIAIAMPCMTLQVLLTPACDARGRPGIGVSNGAIGAVILGCAFLVGVRFGPTGLAAAWVVTYPLYVLASLTRALPVIGARWSEVGGAVVPPLVAAALMAAVVRLVDFEIAGLQTQLRLAILVAVGAVVYGAALVLTARPLLRDIASAIRLR